MGISRVLKFSITIVASLFVTAWCKEAPALFVFGDSTLDNGNNNYLPTVARGNYPPYGVDFPNQVATGRFCNGFQITDYIATFLGLPLLPPYYQYQNQTAFPKGACFASASSGVLPETHEGGAVVLSEQVSAFESAERTLVLKYGCPRAFDIVSKAIYFIVTTNNDVNNYFRAGLPIPYDRIITEYLKQVKRLYALGARKFVLVSPSAAGCIPLNTVNGSCGAQAQNVSSTLISMLGPEINRLRNELTGALIVEPNFFRFMLNVNVNPEKYGFSNSNAACCELSPIVPVVCQPGGAFCPDRSKYAYWDAIHSTERFFNMAAQLWWSGSVADVSPMNIQQLAAA